MKKAKATLLFGLSVSVAFSSTWLVRPTNAASPQFCDQYAQRAIRQFSEISPYVPGIENTDPAWSGDYSYHYNWCLVVPENAANNSTQYRNNQLNLNKALSGYTELLLPGMVIGLRHRTSRISSTVTGYSRSGNQQNLYDPTVLDNSVLTYLHGGDRGANIDVGYNWNSVRDRCPADFDFGFLPPGIVLGLWHSSNQSLGEVTVGCQVPLRNGQSPSGLVVRHGGDQGASSGEGYTWFETTGERFSGDWTIVEYLPKYTVIGLTHTMRRPRYGLRWQGQTYDPSCSSCATPPGFVYMHGGDREAPSGQGFSWYEKITGVEPSDLGGRVRETF